MATEETQSTVRGYTASKQQLLNRLARVEGQVRGLERMVQEDRYCIDVLTQIAAVQAALQQIALGLLDGHVRVCMRDEDGGAPLDPDERAGELMGAVGRLLKQ
jgi:DNA-binding FrmR family transcriptional regulator